MYNKIKRFFDMNLYSKEQVYKFVEKGIITEQEYKEICESNPDNRGEF